MTVPLTEEAFMSSLFVPEKLFYLLMQIGVFLRKYSPLRVQIWIRMRQHSIDDIAICCFASMAQRIARSELFVELVCGFLSFFAQSSHRLKSTLHNVWPVYQDLVHCDGHVVPSVESHEQLSCVIAVLLERLNIDEPIAVNCLQNNIQSGDQVLVHQSNPSCFRIVLEEPPRCVKFQRGSTPAEP